jgi:hypothetical protein
MQRPVHACMEGMSCLRLTDGGGRLLQRLLPYAAKLLLTLSLLLMLLLLLLLHSIPCMFPVLFTKGALRATARL